MSNPFPRSKVIAVESGDSGTFTAFFSDLPAFVVQGASRQDAGEKLAALLNAFANSLKKSTHNLDIETMSLT